MNKPTGQFAHVVDVSAVGLPLREAVYYGLTASTGLQDRKGLRTYYAVKEAKVCWIRLSYILSSTEE